MHKDYGNPFFDDIMSHRDNPDLTWKQHNFNIFSLMFVLAGDLSWFNFELSLCDCNDDGKSYSFKLHLFRW